MLNALNIAVNSNHLRRDRAHGIIKHVFRARCGSGREHFGRGLATYYVLFFLHLESRRVSLAGIIRHPTEQWMEQMARTRPMKAQGTLVGRVLSYLGFLHPLTPVF